MRAFLWKGGSKSGSNKWGLVMLLPTVHRKVWHCWCGQREQTQSSLMQLTKYYMENNLHDIISMLLDSKAMGTSSKRENRGWFFNSGAIWSLCCQVMGQSSILLNWLGHGLVVTVNKVILHHARQSFNVSIIPDIVGSSQDKVSKQRHRNSTFDTFWNAFPPSSSISLDINRQICDKKLRSKWAQQIAVVTTIIL